MRSLFLISVALLLQTYIGYPISLFLIRLLSGRHDSHRKGEATPSVTLIISAYDEEQILQEKLENSLRLDYPAGSIRRIVISDGSLDRTEAIARSYADRGIELRAFSGRRGKVACLNQVIPQLDSDLVIMSDANSIYEPDSLGMLVRHFDDPRVGCVCGALQYTNPRRLAAGEGEMVYWSYETGIKRLESALGTLLGANGAIYAYRRKMFRPVDPLMFCDDVIPIRIAIAGYLTLYDPAARCTELAADEGTEMRRRRRHASFGLRSMIRVVGEALCRGRLLVAYQCVSHRILRWLGGLALAGILVSTPSLPPPWLTSVALGQGLFYSIALLGFVISRMGRRFTPFYLPYYFLVITAAGLLGLWSFLARRDRPFWTPRH